MATSQPESETRRLATLLDSGQFSDATIECGNHVFPVHKVIVFTKSGFFNAAVGGSFSESRENRIELHDEEPGILARVLAFMYLGFYSTSICPTVAGVKLSIFADIQEAEVSNQVLHAKVFAMAEQYDIPPLCKASRIRFLKAWYHEDYTESTIEHGQDESEDKGQNAATVEEVNDTNGATPLWEDAISSREPGLDPESMLPTRSRSSSLASSSAMTANSYTKLPEPIYWYSDSIGETIRTVYTTTAEHVRDLRDIVLRTSLLRIQIKEAIQSRKFRSFLAELPEFARDVAVYEASAGYARCSSCGEDFQVVVAECECGRVNAGKCRKAKCRQKWSEQSFCVECYQLGTMAYPEDGGD